jgi:hypothetical protein
MAPTTQVAPASVIAKRREKVRREWSRTERQIRQVAATIAQQQLYLLIASGPRTAAG